MLGWSQPLDSAMYSQNGHRRFRRNRGRQLCPSETVFTETLDGLDLAQGCLNHIDPCIILLCFAVLRFADTAFILEIERLL